MNSEPLSESMPRRERAAPPELAQRLLHARLALAEHGDRFHPGRVDVGQVEGVDELALGRVARVATRSISVNPGAVTSQ